MATERLTHPTTVVHATMAVDAPNSTANRPCTPTKATQAAHARYPGPAGSMSKKPSTPSKKLSSCKGGNRDVSIKITFVQPVEGDVENESDKKPTTSTEMKAIKTKANVKAQDYKVCLRVRQH